MDRIEKMKQLKEKGLSYGAIGRMFNLSRARIHQLISGYRSRDNSDLKQSIFRRDNWECQWKEMCENKNVYKKDLIIHHIDFNDRNNNPNNLITLCRFCHAKFHSQFIEQIKETTKLFKQNNETKNPCDDKSKMN